MPHQIRVKAGSEAFQEALPAGVTDRVVSGVRPDGEVQADDGTPRAGVFDRRLRQDAQLEATDLLVRCPGCSRHVAQAQPCVDAGVSVIEAESANTFRSPASTAITGSFTGCHGVIVAPEPSLRINWVRACCRGPSWDQVTGESPATPPNPVLRRRSVRRADQTSGERRSPGS
jgi:hypothetical protein